MTTLPIFCLDDHNAHHSIMHDTAIHKAHMMRRPYTVYKDTWYSGSRTIPICFGWIFPSGKILPRDTKTVSLSDFQTK